MNIPDKTTGNVYSGAEFTQFKNETENAILSTGQSLVANSVQLKQAMARYASSGASYTENGIANAYTLIAKGSFDKVSSYQDGQIFIFVAGNSNTGSSQISISGLPSKDIKKNGFSLSLLGGEIIAGNIYSVYYSISADAFELISISSNGISGVLLSSYDMTNSGANDLNNIDINWDISWDAYDYCNFIIINAEASNDGRLAWALSSDSGSTWEQFAGNTKEAMGWSSDNIGLGDTFTAKMELALNNSLKAPHCSRIASKNRTLNGSNNMPQGITFDYSGTTLPNNSSANVWQGWDTGSNGLNGYMLRLAHEVGNFTSGTLKVIGYKYP
jgi:hypothetical protein